MVDKVAGIVEVERTHNGHYIVIRHPASQPDANGLCQIVLLPRYARHLAHLLIEHASFAETDAAVGFEEGIARDPRNRGESHL